MNEETSEFEGWTDVIVDFFENKVAASKLYKAREYIEKKEKEIASEKDPKKLERQNKAKEKKQLELKKLRRDAPKTEIRDWLNQITDTNKPKTPIKESHRISKATHLLKFSHSSSQASSFLVTEKESCPALIITASFKKSINYDMAHNDGTLITISRFMALRLDGVQLIDNIIKNSFTFLKSFSGDQKEIDNWKCVLRKVVIEDGNLKTADKAKQLYFPVSPKASSNSVNPYHLIVPLFASSLANQIHAVITHSKYGKKQKQINKLRRSDPQKFHNDPHLNYTNLGIQKMGGKHPRNVSMLNADRSGIAYLFSTQPPTWQSQLKPPIYQKSLFDYFSNPIINTALDYLRDFLIRFKQLNLSIKDPKRMQHLERWMNTIIDEFIFYVGTIQNLPPGWSDREDIRLKKEHQYLLDPYRMDESFQTARQSGDWQAVIRADFAMWLNWWLRGKNKQFTPQKEHTRLWKKLLETPLWEFMELVEIELKQQARESV